MAQANTIYQEESIPSPLRQIWLNFLSYPMAMLGLWIFAAFVLMAILAPMLAPYPPDFQHTDALLSPPSWHANGNIAYFLGTDDLGRDIFSNLLQRKLCKLRFLLLFLILQIVVRKPVLFTTPFF